MNLISVIQDIRNKILNSERERNLKIKEINSQYDKRLHELENALKVNMELNTTCLVCEGKGTVDIGYYDRMYDTCSACGGKGIVKK